VSEWQPIETAPKDGTQIFAINNRGNRAALRWMVGLNGKEGWIVMFSDANPHPFWNGACGSVPTHWMPLPELPRAAK
jgi:hypothetical protein